MVETKLRHAVIERKMTSRELSRATGISETLMSYRTSGRLMPTPEDLKKICEVLHCEPSDLYHPSDLVLAAPLNKDQMIQMIKAAKEHLDSASGCLEQLM